MSSSPREDRIRELGRLILLSARQEARARRERFIWENRLLEWCMQNEELRTRSLRFIDLFPSLKSDDSIFRHLHEYFPHSEVRLPAWIRNGLALARPAFVTRPVLAAMTRELYLRMARLFIGASGLDEALENFRAYDRRGLGLSMDLLGEKTMSEEEADLCENRYREIILALGREKKGPERQNISVKLSALDPHFSPLDLEGVLKRAGSRLARLLALARGQEVFVHVDMEDYEARDLTIEVLERVLTEASADGVSAGAVLQAYLRDAEGAAERLIRLSGRLKVPLTIRLVRGAYWDTEVMRAREQHWPIPVFTAKENTDAMFERLVLKILDAAPAVRLAAASHNVRSLAFAWAAAEERKIPAENFEFQCLYGMGDPLIPGLVRSAYPVRFYMPVGDPVIGMAYLVRRLLENVSSQSFVRQGFLEEIPDDDLLRPPASAPREEPPLPATAPHQPAAPLAFHESRVRERYREALTRVRLGEEVPCVISGREIRQGLRADRVSPIDGQTRSVSFFAADRALANAAVRAASAGQPAWAAQGVTKRAAMLRRAAALLLERRYEFSAYAVWEAGKPWREADAEVVEAADFLRYYAMQAEILFTEKVTEDLDQETNRLRWQGRGVTAVIAPWNFPLAILTGMSSAALAAGNTVVIKPAEQTVLCAWKIYQLYREAGVPGEAIHFLPGPGETAGDELVRHPDTAVIAFTGSREAGLGILQAASEKKPETKVVKKCLVEMGGKNPAIVDISADFDLAIPAVLHSAFGFAGQKCSALSRLIVLDEIYEEFKNRLVRAAASYPSGSPLGGASAMGPLIDRAALAKMESFVSEGRSEGRVVFEGGAPAGSGYYARPVIFEDLPENSRLLREEIFGPVLCLLRAGSFEEALQKANDCVYALTAAVYSRTPSRLEQARSAIHAGNLYLNRAQTGAIVGRQPFGGYKLSGGGSKAGGEDYLREFCHARTISENVARHGFAPLRPPVK